MLILIGVLVLLFLHQLHLLSGALLRRILLSCGLTVGVGAAYLLAGMLLDQAMFQESSSLGDSSAVFSNAYLKRVYSLLEAPQWTDPLTSAFVWMAHLLGRLLQGQYQFAGLALAFGMDCASVCLIRERIRRIWGDQWARDGGLLLLCLPGAVFLFLPGFPPLALLLISVVFFFAGRRMRRLETAPHVPIVYLLLAVCGILSAFITAALILQKAG